MILLQQMAVFFLVILLGYYCSKKNIWDDAAVKKISGLIVHITNPAMILSAGINQSSSIQGIDLLKTLGLSLGMYLVLILIGFFLPSFLKVRPDERAVYRSMIVFSNIGFMGFPVVQAAYGKEALLYASVFLIPNNVLLYTYGVKLMSGSKESDVSNDSAEKQPQIFTTFRQILNAGVIAGLLSFILYLSQIQVPYVLEQAVTYISNLTAPLSMMIIGDSMSHLDFRQLFRDIRLVLFSVLKLIIIPVLFLFALRMIGVQGHMLEVALVVISTPVGTMNVIFAQQYEGNYELASKGVALTTLLSVATMPLVSMITGI